MDNNPVSLNDPMGDKAAVERDGGDGGGKTPHKTGDIYKDSRTGKYYKITLMDKVDWENEKKVWYKERNAKNSMDKYYRLSTHGRKVGDPAYVKLELLPQGKQREPISISVSKKLIIKTDIVTPPLPDKLEIPSSGDIEGPRDIDRDRGDSELKHDEEITPFEGYVPYHPRIIKGDIPFYYVK